MARTKAFDESVALEKAMKVFWCKGYNGTSMQDLVDQMGISRQSLYDTYGDKHQLYIAALEQMKMRGSQQFEQVCTQNASIKQILQNYLNQVINEILKDKENKGCMMANAILEMVPEDAAVKKIAASNYLQLEKALSLLLSKAINNKEIVTTYSPEALAAHFINTLHGLRVTGKVKKDRQVLEDIAAVSLSILN